MQPCDELIFLNQRHDGLTEFAKLRVGTALTLPLDADVDGDEKFLKHPSKKVTPKKATPKKAQAAKKAAVKPPAKKVEEAPTLGDLLSMPLSRHSRASPGELTLTLPGTSLKFHASFFLEWFANCAQL